MRAYDEEVGLADLAEETDEEDDPRSPMIGQSHQGNGHWSQHRPNGSTSRLSVKSGQDGGIELQQGKKSGER